MHRLAPSRCSINVCGTEDRGRTQVRVLTAAQESDQVPLGLVRYPPLASLCPQGPPPLLEHPSHTCQIVGLTNVRRMNEAVSLKTQIISHQSKAWRQVRARMRFESSEERTTVISEVKLGAPGSSWELLGHGKSYHDLTGHLGILVQCPVRVMFCRALHCIRPSPLLDCELREGRDQALVSDTFPMLSTVRRCPVNAS